MVHRIVAWFKKPNKSTLEQWIEALIKVVPIAFVIRTFGYGLYKVPSGSMETTMLVGESFIADKCTVWFRPIVRGEIISFNDPTYKYSTNTFKNFLQRYVDIIWGPSNWTKRVIGIPGDHVKGVVEDGKPVIYLNGKKLDEPYLNKWPLLYVYKNRIVNAQDVYLQQCEFDIISYQPDVPFDQQEFYKVDPLKIYDFKKVTGRTDTGRSDAVYDVERGMLMTPPNVPMFDGSDVFDVQLGADEYWVMGDNRLGSYDSRAWGKLKAQLIHGKIKYRIFSFDSDESWMVVDLIKHPIDFWKKIRWSRCFQSVN